MIDSQNVCRSNRCVKRAREAYATPRYIALSEFFPRDKIGIYVIVDRIALPLLSSPVDRRSLLRKRFREKIARHPLLHR